jgi:hypothetical protein
MSNIKALKLVSGEELVAEIVNEDDNVVELNNVVAAVLQRRQEGPTLGFMPWMQAANGPKFTIAKDKLICVTEVADEVRNGYNQIFGAGIMVPPQQLITG